MLEMAIVSSGGFLKHSFVYITDECTLKGKTALSEICIVYAACQFSSCHLFAFQLLYIIIFFTTQNIKQF